MFHHFNFKSFHFFWQIDTEWIEPPLSIHLFTYLFANRAFMGRVYFLNSNWSGSPPSRHLYRMTLWMPPTSQIPDFFCASQISIYLLSHWSDFTFQITVGSTWTSSIVLATLRQQPFIFSIVFSSYETPLILDLLPTKQSPAPPKAPAEAETGPARQPFTKKSQFDSSYNQPLSFETYSTDITIIR